MCASPFDPRFQFTRKISQEKLAEKVDLNIRNVQRIEAGEINILITTAKRIKTALECSWDDLMEK